MLSSYAKKTLASMTLGVCLPLLSFGAASAVNEMPQAENPLAHDKAQITVLKNGLTVYIIEDDRFPLVATRLYVKAGSAYENIQDAGISHVLEHMVFKGTNKRPKGVIAREVEAAGGYLNASTSFDYTKYLVDLPSKHWALSLDIVKDMAFYPTLDAEELESEKKVVLSELKLYEDKPNSKVFETLQQAVLKGTPYAHPIIGFEDTIKAVTPASMRAYIAKYYQPQNMLLTVVGDVDAEKVLEESERLFGQLQNSTDMTPVQPIDASLLQSASVEVQESSWKKVYLGIALPVPGFTDNQYIPLDVFAKVLGGDATSYLYKKYKYEKQLVDSIYSVNYSFERVGLLYFYIELDAENVEAFWKEFTADMASLKASMFTQKDIARAQLHMEERIHRSKETLSGLSSSKGYAQLFLHGAQGEKNFLTALAQVDEQQLQESLDMWFVPQRVNVLALTPKGTKIPDLQAILHEQWPVTAQKTSTASKAEAGERRIVDLGDGRKVVLIPDANMPYTAVDFYMAGGNALSDKKEGLATLTASVLTTGTKKMTAPQIDTYLAERAASLGAAGNRQTFRFAMKQPSRFNADMFALMKDILTEPAFNAEEVQREKKTQVAAIVARDDDPIEYTFARIAPFLFGSEHPYGLQSLGTIEGVEKLTQEDVANFWKKQSVEPWVLSVAGDFDAEEVLAFARSLPKPEQTAVAVNAPTWTQEKKLAIHLPEREQAHHALIFKTVPNNHEDAAALELLQLALSGQSGLLFRELRDKQGLGYTVSVGKGFFPTTGYFLFYIGTEEQKLVQAREGFKGVIQDVQKDLLPLAEIEKAKNQMEGNYYRGIQSLGARAGEAALNLTLGQDLDFRKQFIAKAQKLTAEDLRRVAQKYLNMDDAYVIDVTP